MLVQSAMMLANSQMVAMVLVRRGDADNGAILVRLDLPDGTSVVARRVLNFDGDYEWTAMTDAPIPAADAETYCQREINIDPDRPSPVRSVTRGVPFLIERIHFR